MKIYIWVGVLATLFAWWMLDFSFMGGLLLGGVVAGCAMWFDADEKKAAPPVQNQEIPKSSTITSAAKNVAVEIAKDQAKKILLGVIKRSVR